MKKKYSIGIYCVFILFFSFVFSPTHSLSIYLYIYISCTHTFKNAFLLSTIIFIFIVFLLFRPFLIFSVCLLHFLFQSLIAPVSWFHLPLWNSLLQMLQLHSPSGGDVSGGDKQYIWYLQYNNTKPMIISNPNECKWYLLWKFG